MTGCGPTNERHGQIAAYALLIAVTPSVQADANNEVVLPPIYTPSARTGTNPGLRQKCSVEYLDGQHLLPRQVRFFNDGTFNRYSDGVNITELHSPPYDKGFVQARFEAVVSTNWNGLMLPLRVVGRDEASYRSEVIELLRWVGLGDRMAALPPILSGGEKQRAAIARAVIAQPSLLLADEPTGNVDPNLARRLLRLLVELNKSGTSVVIATHDIALMDLYDAPRLVLHEGRLQVYA